MNNIPTYRYAFCLSAGALFIYLACALTGAGNAMFGDTDPLWHLSAGDWIRAHHAIPLHDPWSFTATDYRWLNISWAWDCLLSALHEQLGWHGAFALNALTLSATLTLIYITCWLRSAHMGWSLLATIGAVTLFSLHLRPLQITGLMSAGWMLLLGLIMRSQLRARWLLLLPLTIIIWVNCHGGFLVGLLLIGAFFLQALTERRYRLANQLALTGIASIAALLCNPYGTDIVEAAWRPLTTVANQFIIEWQPLTLSPRMLLLHGYAVLFLLLALRRPLPSLLPAERWLAYLWLALGITSMRHLAVFAVLAPPVLACALKDVAADILPAWPHGQDIRNQLLKTYNQRWLAALTLAGCLLTILLLPSPWAARWYAKPDPEFLHLTSEIAYIRSNLPHARLLTHFNLGAVLTYETHGEIPVFIDPRTETAFPAQVMRDYMRFIDATPGWEAIMDRYQLDGILIPNDKNEKMELLQDRFRQRVGWKMAFSGPEATIFLRINP